MLNTNQKKRIIQVSTITLTIIIFAAFTILLQQALVGLEYKKALDIEVIKWTNESIMEMTSEEKALNVELIISSILSLLLVLPTSAYILWYIEEELTDAITEIVENKKHDKIANFLENIGDGILASNMTIYKIIILYFILWLVILIGIPFIITNLGITTKTQTYTMLNLLCSVIGPSIIILNFINTTGRRPNRNASAIVSPDENVKEIISEEMRNIFNINNKTRLERSAEIFAGAFIIILMNTTNALDTIEMFGVNTEMINNTILLYAAYFIIIKRR